MDWVGRLVGFFVAIKQPGLLFDSAQQSFAHLLTSPPHTLPTPERQPPRSLSSSEAKKLPGGEITAGQVHQLAKDRVLPPCMSLMYERLAGEHHLKHYGLQQMSLFLKHVGLPLEQAVMFWRSMFSPRTTGEKFNREYAYNIRYNYAQVGFSAVGRPAGRPNRHARTHAPALPPPHPPPPAHNRPQRTLSTAPPNRPQPQEGKRTDWNEWSCVRIIQKEVGPCASAGECNGGCPFKTLDEAKLRALLGRMSCGERCGGGVCVRACVCVFVLESGGAARWGGGKRRSGGALHPLCPQLPA